MPDNASAEERKRAAVRRPTRISERNKLGVQLLFVCMIFLTLRIIFRGLAEWKGKTRTTTTATEPNIVKRAISSTSSGPTPTSTGLENVFMVYPPVFGPYGAVDEVISSSGSSSGQETASVIEAASSTSPSCQVLLMQYDFANSYGQPFVGEYTPPSCKFNRVIMNFTVEVRGVQYDRLALMYFNDTEVWRTSTAEPTQNGIEWTYIKDMSHYLYFWNSPQKLIFDLGNIYDSTYTGIYNTTLTATFWEGEDTVNPANLIIPISAHGGNSNSGSIFVVPSDNATNTISFPRNVNRAVFSVASCGQSTEEFWWSNVLQSDVNTFESIGETLYGYSPFREVQVLLDGKLIGVQWPFPVIFTGGVVPELWNPIVGIQAFDLLEHEIDITPWLPLLCDGKEHTFQIKVVGIIDDGKTGGVLSDFVGNSWYVSGKIFVWLDENPNHITTGTTPLAIDPDPVITTSQKITQDSSGNNLTLTFTADVKRSLSISSWVTSQKSSILQTWSQTLSATNYGSLTNYSYFEINQQSTKGLDISTGAVGYSTTYSYPLFANTTELVYPNGDFTLEAYISRSMDTSVLGTPVFPTGLQAFSAISSESSLVDGLEGTYLSTTENGSATYIYADSKVVGFGSTSQVMTFGGAAVAGVLNTELYYRNVEGVNRTVVRDQQVLLGKTVSDFGVPVQSMGKAVPNENILSPKAAFGRGPGSAQPILVQGGGSR